MWRLCARRFAADGVCVTVQVKAALLATALTAVWGALGSIYSLMGGSDATIVADVATTDGRSRRRALGVSNDGAVQYECHVKCMCCRRRPLRATTTPTCACEGSAAVVSAHDSLPCWLLQVVGLLVVAGRRVQRHDWCKRGLVEGRQC